MRELLDAAVSFAGAGELAALGAASFWVVTSLAFAAAARRIGPTMVNLLRMLAALCVLLVVHRLWFGALLPSADFTLWFWLGISGLVGLAIGDQLLFTALVDIGPRLSTLFMTLAPPVTAIVAWPVLGEPLSWIAILGISVTISGVAWVALERPERPTVRRTMHHRPPRSGRGMLCGALAGACQASGIILAKKAMLHAEAEGIVLHAWSVTLLRMVSGVIGIVTLVALLQLHRRIGRSSRRSKASFVRDMDEIIEVSAESERLPPPRTTFFESAWPFALAMIAIGVAFGPVCGVWLSMVAVGRTKTGIAATLMSMTPVFILPFAAWIERERITWRSVLGACVAIAGVAILMMRG